MTFKERLALATPYFETHNIDKYEIVRY